MKTRAMTGLAAMLIVTGGCAMGITAGADFAPTADFEPYTTFSFDEPDDRPVGDPRLENNPFFEDRLHAAIAAELAGRGIREGQPGPALLVHHHAAVRDRVDVYEADARAGYRTSEYGEGTQVVQYEEGTILVDIADAKTREVLWRGWAQFDIGRAIADADVLADAIEDAVRKMFRSFPRGR